MSYWHGSPIHFTGSVGAGPVAFCTPDIRYALIYTRDSGAVYPNQKTVYTNYDVTTTSSEYPGMMLVTMHGSEPGSGKCCLSATDLISAPGGYLYRVDPTGCRPGPGAQNDFERAYIDDIPILECIPINNFTEACKKYGLRIIDS
jgi:hypothetical protein